MLFEKLTYQDDFPINVAIASLEEYPIHYHQDIEFLYVLKGSVSLKNGSCIYTLQEGDIFVNAGHEIHGMKATDEENVVAIIQISTRYFSQYFPSLGAACYRTYSKKAANARLDNLREMLLQIILQYNIKSFNYKNDCIRLMKDVINCLDKYFNLFAFEEEMPINVESVDQIAIDRISRIINYIYQNYAEKIRLEELSAMEHLSMFYVSHIIKNCTGKNFREFLCFARVERSEVLLLDTNKKISQIAKDYGKSAKWLNNLLHELGIQYNQSGVWLLYQKYAQLGYTRSKTHTYSGNDGKQHSKLHTYWTQKGRLFIYQLLKDKGVLPLIEME